MIVNIGTSSTLLLAHGVRKSVILDNRGANTVWCRFHSGADSGADSTAAAVVNEGFALDPGDKLILETNKGNIDHPIYAIAETGTSDVSVYAWT